MTTPKPKLNITSVLTRYTSLWRAGAKGDLISVPDGWEVIKGTLSEYFEIDNVEISPEESASPKIEGGTSDILPTVRFRRLPHAGDLPLPAYESSGAAAMDLRATTIEQREITVLPGVRVPIATGFEVAIPPGYEGQVRPRSGLALKDGITIANSPGTIDCDYRGEIKVILVNHSPVPFRVNHGDRIAQLVIAPVTHAAVEEVTELDQTERGSGGFGSTGVK